MSIAQNIEKMLAKSATYSYQKNKKKYILKFQFGLQLGKYSNVQQNISKILKGKLYAHIGKYKYFFTLQFAEYLNLIQPNITQMWNQIQNNFSNFN